MTLKKISVHAFVVAQRDGTLDLGRVEPFSDDGRSELVRTLNRPAGERVVHVKIIEHR